MKTITNEINLLDIEDVEQAISDYLDREVKISDVDCILTYCIAVSDYTPCGMLLWFDIEDDGFSHFDLFSDEECYKGKKLSLNGICLPPGKIFNFDISNFKSFSIEVDSE